MLILYNFTESRLVSKLTSLGNQRKFIQPLNAFSAECVQFLPRDITVDYNGRPGMQFPRT